jgi:hypothetical protein
VNALLRRLLRAHGSPEYPESMARRNGFLLVRTDFWLRDVGREALGALGLDQRLFTALAVLDALGPCPQQRLPDELDVSGTIVVQLADRLERRAPWPGNARSGTAGSTCSRSRRPGRMRSPGPAG